MIKCLRFYDVKEFLTKSESFLLQFEAENNLPLGILMRQSNINNNDISMYQILKADALYGIAIINDYNLILTRLDEMQIYHLQEILIQDNVVFNHVASNIITSEYFAKTWANKTNLVCKLFHETQILKLSKIDNPCININNNTVFRQATNSDSQLVYNLLHQFEIYSNPDKSEEENYTTAVNAANRHIANNDAFLITDII